MTIIKIISQICLPTHVGIVITLIIFVTSFLVMLTMIMVMPEWSSMGEWLNGCWPAGCALPPSGQKLHCIKYCTKRSFKVKKEKRLKLEFCFQIQLDYVTFMHQYSILYYSLVRLVVPKTEELISRPLEGLLKIRLLFQDGMRSLEFRN